MQGLYAQLTKEVLLIPLYIYIYIYIYTYIYIYIYIYIYTYTYTQYISVSYPYREYSPAISNFGDETRCSKSLLHRATYKATACFIYHCCIYTTII